MIALLLRRVAALATALAVAGCAASGSPAQRDSNTLVALIRTDATTLSPLYGEQQQDGVFAGLVFEALTSIDKSYAPVPDLATSWSPSPDGLVWTVNLRHGVQWSDGRPFTAKDVVFSYRIMLDPKTAFTQESSIDYVKSVTEVNPYQVRFVLIHPSSLFVSVVLGESILPEHILGSIPAAKQPFTNFGEHPVGTGPYMLTSWQHDSELIFVRNAHYWQGKPKIARLDFRVIFNDEAEVDALENGSADLIDDLSHIQAERLAKEAPSIKVQTFESIQVDAVEPNLRRPGLSDLVVRKAMMYGYDRAAVVRGFFGNAVQIVDQPIAPGLARWYDPNTVHYPYEPAKARAMLEADGWKVGPGGVRTKDGVRLSYECLLNQGSAIITDEMLAWVNDMKAIGIDVRLRLLDFPSLITRAFQGRYDLVAIGYGGITDPGQYIDSFLSTSQPPKGQNTMGYRNPIVDRILEEGLRTVDFAKQHQLYTELQVQLADTLPLFVQYTRFAANAHNARLELDPNVTLQMPFAYYNVQDWVLKP